MHTRDHSRGAWAVLGRGLTAGLAGTMALSACDLLERRLLGREPVYSPARLVARLAARRGVAVSPGRARRLGSAIRWLYGPALGITSTWLDPPSEARIGRALRRSAGILGFELVVLPLVGAVPPLGEWPLAEALMLAGHTTVFAVAAELPCAVARTVES